ncbi:MAG: substrate-binding domain-containing protein [Ruminococcus sp.]|jgi:ABC-type phosphate transport system substrate-binding protein|nr:substrate-binding domain-containing protein [Ruminococcus sp.]
MKRFLAIFTALIIALSFAISTHADENYPVFDGSTSTVALDAAFRSSFLGESYTYTYYQTEHSKTFQSFERLLKGAADIILSVPVTPEQEAKASERGFNLGSRAVALEGFVFIVNPENPVSDLSQAELRDIYTGRVTNWKEFGFDDAQILAYQRNEDSGSQSFMNEFMGDEKLSEPPTEWLFGGMGHLVDAVSDYDNSKYAIGYSVYSYALEQMAKEKNLKILAVDGVFPKRTTLEDGSYPLYSYTYAYYNADTDKQIVLQLLDFMISDKGQRAASEHGYVPIRPLPEKETYKALGTGSPRPEDWQPSHEYSWRQFMSEDYLYGVLTDAALEEKINTWIADTLKKVKPLDTSEYPFDDYSGVLFTAVNGYLNVGVGTYQGESYTYRDDAIISVWNMRTGERLEKFSDMFYEGEDFVPAVNSALKNYSGDLTYFLQGEPENFSTTSLTIKIASSDYYWARSELSETALYALSKAWDFMPAWDYFDMTEMFINPEYTETRSFALWIEHKTSYEDMLVRSIASSRFYSDEEIAALNEGFAKLYDYIKTTDEFADYEYDSEFDEPYVTVIDILDGKPIVKTPFGMYMLNEAGEIDSPTTNPLLKAVYITGAVDLDLDGKSEYFYASGTGFINLYDEELEFLGKLDFKQNISEITAWQVVNDTNYNKDVSGRIIADDLTVLQYHFRGEKLVVDGCKTLTSETRSIFSPEKTNYGIAPGGYGSFPLEIGYPYMETEIKDGVTSAFYFYLGSTDDYAFEMLFEDTQDKQQETIAKLVSEKKPFALILDKEPIIITEESLPEKYFGEGKIIVRRYGDSTLTETSDPKNIGNTIFALYSDGKVSFPFGEEGAKVSLTNNKIITFKLTQTDEFTANGKSYGETQKDYRYTIEDGELKKVPGEILSLTDFKKIDGARQVVKDLEAEGATITSILRFADDFIAVNYSKPWGKNQNITENYYKIYDSHFWFYGNSLTPRASGKGHYVP